MYGKQILKLIQHPHRHLQLMTQWKRLKTVISFLYVFLARLELLESRTILENEVDCQFAYQKLIILLSNPVKRSLN